MFYTCQLFIFFVIIPLLFVFLVLSFFYTQIQHHFYQKTTNTTLHIPWTHYFNLIHYFLGPSFSHLKYPWKRCMVHPHCHKILKYDSLLCDLDKLLCCIKIINATHSAYNLDCLLMIALILELSTRIFYPMNIVNPIYHIRTFSNRSWCRITFMTAQMTGDVIHKVFTNVW